MIRLLLRFWYYIVPFIFGYICGMFVLGVVGPAVASLGSFAGVFVTVFPIMTGVIAVEYLAPRFKRFFRE